MDSLRSPVAVPAAVRPLGPQDEVFDFRDSCVPRETESAADRQRVPFHRGMTAFAVGHNDAGAGCRYPAQHLVDERPELWRPTNAQLDERHEPPVGALPLVAIRMASNGST